jgi:hypothetical protein
MTAIFVNYRTKDGAWAAREIRKSLAKRLGSENVFCASRSIKLGEDFAETIKHELDQCEILLAVIGPNWLQTGANGRRRIDEPDDWVRIEIREALNRGIPVIPILLDGIERLREADLPADIAELARRQDLALHYRADDKQFESLVDELVGLLPDISRYRAELPDDRISRRSPGPLGELADQLADAVLAQWVREEESRGLHDPAPLQVRWTNADESVVDHWANILGSPRGVHPDPLDLAGELDEITDTYRRLPRGRLVVLGGAGSGKTVLAIRFTLSMLGSRSTADRVPVIFNLATWHPPTTDFRDWLAAQLADNYPALAARGPNGSTLAADLVGGDRILPVLDGFDEIADGLHRLALKSLNASGLPMLLTSRVEEYASAPKNVLGRAAAIDVTPLAVTDLAEYLPSTTHRHSLVDGRPGSLWAPVLTRLAERPPSRAAANLAEALSTPLMVGLARAIYSDSPDHDPAELLNGDRFGTTAAIEQHLLQGYVPALYENTRTRRFDAARAERWLGFLADHLQRTESRDLAWWRVCSAIPRHTRATVIGAAVATTVVLLLALVLGTYWLVESGDTGSVFPPVRLLFALVCGFAAAIGAGAGYTWRTVSLLVLTCGAAISAFNLFQHEPLNSALEHGLLSTLIFVLMLKLSAGNELSPSRVRFTLHGQSTKYLNALLFIVVGGVLGFLCATYFDAALRWSTNTFHTLGTTLTVFFTVAFGLIALLVCASCGFRPRSRLRSAVVSMVAVPAAAYCFLMIVHGPPAALSDLVPAGPPLAAIGFAAGLPVSGVTTATSREVFRYLIRTRLVRYMTRGSIAGAVLKTMSLTFPAILSTELLGPDGDFNSGTEEIIGGAVFGAICGMVAALVVGLLKVIEKFEAEFDIAVALAPAFLLAADRRNALARSLLYALTLGGVGGLIQVASSAEDEPWFMVGATLGLPVATVVLLGGTAWGRWLVLTRVWLPLTGKLPWRLLEFLEDAHRRGILRQVGAVYQFRHARLQEQLAERYRHAAEPDSSTPENVHRRTT